MRLSFHLACLCHKKIPLFSRQSTEFNESKIFRKKSKNLLKTGETSEGFILGLGFHLPDARIKIESETVFNWLVTTLCA